MSIVPFVAGVLAVWRLTHLVVEEDGPWDVFLRLRGAARAIGVERLVGCFLCFSVWAAAAVALLLSRDWREVVLLVPAFSGGAILLERATAPKFPPSLWLEEEEPKEKESTDVLLRR